MRDATDLAIAAATVVATTAGGVEHRGVTADSGSVEIQALPPGRYSVRVEAPGFEPQTLSDITVRSGGRTTRELTLRIAGFVEELDVLPDASDRQLAEAFTTTLTEEQLAALPEDPDELAEVLAQLAGVDAEFRVDGFLDGTLPPGTQIQSVIIRYDAASAGSSGGGPRVEIRTQPGGDRWRNTFTARLRDEALNARNAFASTRPTGQTRQYSWSINGPVVRNRTGLSLSIDRSDGLDQRAIRAATLSGIFTALVRQPTERLSFSTRLEHAITPAQRLRVDFRNSREDALNQGLGEFDLPERGFTRANNNGALRVGHNATLRREMVHDFRFQATWNSNEIHPANLDTAVRVPGSLAFGGAQAQGGRTARQFEIEDELTFSRGRHQIYTGINLTGSHFRGDEWRNAGGSFTFASLEDLAAGRPTTYTQRLGDPSFEYSLYRGGAFVQDDFRVRRNLVLNFGIRHELQSHLSDWANFAPRLGANWTPSSRTRTTLRASYGVTYQPFQGSFYEQTLLVNGARQRELVIPAPSYPDPFVGGVTAATAPAGIIRAARDLVMPSVRRISVGVDQPLAKLGRVRATYSRQLGQHLFRSLDRNAPIDGVRPDPSVRNITELESTARSRNQSLEVNLALNYPRARLTSNATYVLGSQWNETDGPLTLPPDSLRLDNEWGPSRQDIRHRFDLSAASDVGLGFRINVNTRFQSTAPYTITTGLDLNGDGVNNERPDGLGRNTGRGAGTKNLDLTLTWSKGVGERVVPAGRVRPGAPPSRPSPFVRFELFVQANNALNLVNPQSFSGVLTSPFFGRPTSAAAPRRISIGSRVYL